MNGIYMSQNETTMTVGEAFQAWVNIDQEKCRCKSHSRSRFTETGFLIDPTPANEVCQKELAWRRYVELRDGQAPGWASNARLRPYRRALG